MLEITYHTDRLNGSIVRQPIQPEESPTNWPIHAVNVFWGHVEGT